MAPLETLAQLHAPIHLLLTRESSLGTTTLVSSAFIEWRKVLVHGRISLNVELKGSDGQSTTQQQQPQLRALALLSMFAPCSFLLLLCVRFVLQSWLSPLACSSWISRLCRSRCHRIRKVSDIERQQTHSGQCERSTVLILPLRVSAVSLCFQSFLSSLNNLHSKSSSKATSISLLPSTLAFMPTPRRGGMTSTAFVRCIKLASSKSSA